MKVRLALGPAMNPLQAPISLFVKLGEWTGWERSNKIMSRGLLCKFKPDTNGCLGELKGSVLVQTWTSVPLLLLAGAMPAPTFCSVEWG